MRVAQLRASPSSDDAGERASLWAWTGEGVAAAGSSPARGDFTLPAGRGGTFVRRPGVRGSSPGVPVGADSPSPTGAVGQESRPGPARVCRAARASGRPCCWPLPLPRRPGPAAGPENPRISCRSGGSSRAWTRGGAESCAAGLPGTQGELSTPSRPPRVTTMFRKYAIVRQNDQSDCGAAALATVALHHRRAIGLERVRDLAGTDRVGTNLLGVVRAAEAMGFTAKGAKGSYESLLEAPLPAIVHVKTEEGYGHFVVLHRVDREKVIVADPARGIRDGISRGRCRRRVSSPRAGTAAPAAAAAGSRSAARVPSRASPRGTGPRCPPRRPPAGLRSRAPAPARAPPAPAPAPAAPGGRAACRRSSSSPAHHRARPRPPRRRSSSPGC